MYVKVGSCPKCGAPVFKGQNAAARAALYAKSLWWGVTPPQSTHSCSCVRSVPAGSDNTARTTINTDYGHVAPDTGHTAPDNT